MEAMLPKINPNQRHSVHDGLQKEKSPLSLPLRGIGLTISLKPDSKRRRARGHQGWRAGVLLFFRRDAVANVLGTAG